MGKPSSTWPDVGFGAGVRVYSGYANDYAIALALSGGKVYVTGQSQFAAWDNRLVTLAYEGETGALLWTASYPNVNYNLTYQRNIIAADYTRGVYVTAMTEVGKVGSQNNRLFIAKYNPATGQLLWDYIDNSGFGGGCAIDYFSKRIGESWPHTNDIFVTGWVGPYMTTIKIDDNRNERWNKKYSSISRGNAIAIDAYENVFVTGYAFNTTFDIITVKYDISGNQAGAVPYNGTGNNSYDEGYSIATGFNGDVYVAGIGNNVGTNDDYTTIKYMSSGNGPLSFQNPNLLQSNKNEILSSFYELNQNYPNPFNPETKIHYAIPQSGKVILKVYDMLGREVQSLVNEFKNAGFYTVPFDGTNLSSGVYIYRIQSGEFTDMKKMILMK